MHNKQSKKILERIGLLIERDFKGKRCDMLQAFAVRYLSTISYRDLSARTPEDWYGALCCHWQLLARRLAGDVSVRVYNPAAKRDGWEAVHTIIQIVHDDMPFLVDSIRMEINRQGLLPSLIINSGALHFKRDAAGKISKFFSGRPPGKQVSAEACIYVEVNRRLQQKAINALSGALRRVLSDVAAVVEDWQAMQAQIEDSLQRLEREPPTLNTEELEESKAFLRWLVNHHFTFLGCRDYRYTIKNGVSSFHPVRGSGLGVLRSDRSAAVRRVSEMPVVAQRRMLSSQVLIFAKTRTRATVHRPAYTDYVGVKQFRQGQLIGERRYIGLYTSSAYNSRTSSVPFLRHKVAKVMKRSRFGFNSHAGKNLLNILESLPRDDLFQATAAELFKLSMDILHLQDRQQIRLFVRKNSYGRFYSCLVFVPRDKFDSSLCLKMERVLAASLQTDEISFEPLFSESALACVHFVAHIDDGKRRRLDIAKIEKKLVEVSQTWQDKLRDALLARHGEAKGERLYRFYCNAFPVNYREYFTPEEAIRDIKYLETLHDGNPFAIDFYDPQDDRGYLRFKMFGLYHTAPLSDALPIFDNMGLRVIGERPYPIATRKHCAWINDFDLHYVADKNINIHVVKDTFQRAFAAVWRQHTENDEFNILILSLNLHWREVALLRAYAKYFKQLGSAFSNEYIVETLNANADITMSILLFFKLKFDPHVQRSKKALDRKERIILEKLNQVPNLDQDRILRRYLEVIKATLRVNFFQKNDFFDCKPYFTFKINPEALSNIPLPKPAYEIYVYSPQFEGIHLRCAKVARGGLRWSDRREDFRTEVLGLMKAQQVKNSCIIPQGAKGSFITKEIAPSASRDVVLAEGIKCYRLFIQAMIGITDNIVGGKVVTPENTVIYDDEDPYLVVAADKGTATFSDSANEVAQKNNFWLGDAFASGGSTGYDHKKIGITARGVWESVKCHFRELGRDVENQGCTVCGIGDMAGDVFGNGMLLCKRFSLVAAFNHSHIFIDPKPNVAKSFKERARLFKLSRSTWDDYDRKIISKGGGVFRRTDKAIKVSPQMKRLLGIDKEYVIPDELIHHVLMMEVDLLWNGGIGTFVKASYESHAQARDRSNDATRIDATELKCKVIGEGGNLGLTQLARIEYDLQGGHVFTDFIDNSAGVSCSDHEVNLKILIGAAVTNKKLTEAERNNLLSQLTDEVAAIVLNNNYHQTQAINLAVIRARYNIDLYVRYMRVLIERSGLNPELEFLPNDKVIQARKASGKGLTRPELAVLFAYSKSLLKKDILESTVPEDVYLSQMLWQEFPKIIRQNFEAEMKSHILRREITATQLSNTLVNELGCTFILRMQEETGASVEHIVRAFAISQKIFGKRSLWKRIESLDDKINSDTQFFMMRHINRLMRRAIRWFLRNRRNTLEISSTVERYANPLAILANQIPDCLSDSGKAHYESQLNELQETGVPQKLAARVASIKSLFSALDIVEVSLERQYPVEEVAKVYYAVGDKIGLAWVHDKMLELVSENQWQALLTLNLNDDLDLYQRILTTAILKNANATVDVQAVEDWLIRHRNDLAHWYHLIAMLKASSTIDIVRLSVAIRELVHFIDYDITHCDITTEEVIQQAHA